MLPLGRIFWYQMWWKGIPSMRNYCRHHQHKEVYEWVYKNSLLSIIFTAESSFHSPGMTTYSQSLTLQLHRKLFFSPSLPDIAINRAFTHLLMSPKAVLWVDSDIAVIMLHSVPNYVIGSIRLVHKCRFNPGPPGNLGVHIALFTVFMNVHGAECFMCYGLMEMRCEMGINCLVQPFVSCKSSANAHWPYYHIRCPFCFHFHSSYSCCAS